MLENREEPYNTLRIEPSIDRNLIKHKTQDCYLVSRMAAKAQKDDWICRTFLSRCETWLKV